MHIQRWKLNFLSTAAVSEMCFIAAFAGMRILCLADRSSMLLYVQRNHKDY